MRASFLALSLAFLLLPTVAQADNFHSLTGKTIFQSRDHTYRLRGDTKPWQLTEQTGNVLASALIGETLHTAIGDKLYRSSDGLRYVADSSVGTFEAAVIVRVADQSFLSASINGATKIHHLVNDIWRETAGWSLAAPDDIRNAFLSNASIASLAIMGDEVKVFLLSGDTWIEEASLTCDNAAIFISPRPAAICDNGENFYLSDAFAWEELFPTTIEGQSIGSNVAAAFEQNNKNRLYVATESEILTIDLQSVELPASLSVAGSRVLLNFPTLGLHELLWQEPLPTLVPITTSFTNIVEVENDPDLALISADSIAYHSLAPGQWQTMAALGDFNHASSTSRGIFVWQTNEVKTSGGHSQFLPDGQTSFVKVNVWASTTSPVQAVSLNSFPSYVSVVTNSGSGNTNLYKSNDYLSWSRVSLPTTPTLPRTIGEARNLSPGTLLETLATVSVPAGIVGNEIEYIQDETGGIQMYLSQSKGALNFAVNSLVRVTGEISSSATKRILLDALDDVSAEGTGEISFKSISAAQADSSQGLVANVTDNVSELNADELVLGGILEVDMRALEDSAKTIFKLKDQVELPVLVDWNSASDKTEAWYLGSYKILSREPEVETVTVPKTTKSTKQPAATKSTSSSGSKATARSSTAQKSAAGPTAKVSNVKTKPVLVEGVKTAKPGAQSRQNSLPATDTVTLGILGITAGMLAMQGRRLRRLLQI
ncbi:MAG: hypothetical protein HZB70_02250 [Candidatus Berkelbacteria bacterium]|nr:MAG: hypothetical protein HZB70_02250 [Candidatus Berkelbacteria bacterium]QQG51862.1 MAG: hypothetical protein HY845_00745 [Candidatus Berkelbacteria bacterium]